VRAAERRHLADWRRTQASNEPILDLRYSQGREAEQNPVDSGREAGEIRLVKRQASTVKAVGRR
jgi:hypothetical protein